MPFSKAGAQRATALALATATAGLGVFAGAANAAGPDSLVNWGFGNLGRLGNGSGAEHNVPTDIVLPAGVTGVKSVHAGSHTHNLAVTTDGQLLAWGQNNQGQLGDGTTTNRSTPTLVDFGGQLQPGETIVDAAGGEDHSYALTSEGRAFAWGNGAWGNLGTGSTANEHLPVPVTVPVGVTLKDIDAGYNNGIALTTDGEVLTFGRGASGNLGNGSNASQSLPVPVDLSILDPGEEIAAVESRTDHSLALTTQGRVIAWGDNPWGQLGDGTTTGSNTPVLVNIPADETIASIGIGWDQSLAVTTDGEGLAWGTDDFGQLGDDNPNPVVQTQVRSVILPAGVQLMEMQGGVDTTIALTTDGRVLHFGYGGSGIAGDGTSNTYDVPHFVTPPPHTVFKDIDLGEYSNLSVADLNTEPTVSIVSPADGAVLEAGSSVAADYSCGDAEGLDTCVGDLPDGDLLDTSQTGTFTFSVTATDAQGLATTIDHDYAVVDTTDPSVTITSPVDGAVVEYGEPAPMADFACSDLLLASCVGTVPDGQPVDVSSLGTKSFTVTATDIAGNEAAETVSYEVADTTDPQVTISSPVDGGTYLKGSTVAADYACSDLLLDTCSGTVADGAAIDTSSVGVKSFSLTGTDTSGNTTTRTVSYRVRDATSVVARPSVLQLGPGLKLTLRFEARLTDASGSPLAGRTLRFDALGSARCSAVTNAQGVAACGVVIDQVVGILGLGYTASFGGQPDYLPSSDRGPIVQVGGLKILG